LNCAYCGNIGNRTYIINRTTQEYVKVCDRCYYFVNHIVLEYGGKKGYYLCLNCGRHFTSSKSKLCYYCENKDTDEFDWFGKRFCDRTYPLYRYNYSWTKVNWL